MIMSLRVFEKQSIVTGGDCFATARNDMPTARLASLRELQSATGEELRPRRTLLPSVLRPQGGAFKGEL